MDELIYSVRYDDPDDWMGSDPDEACEEGNPGPTGHGAGEHTDRSSDTGRDDDISHLLSRFERIKYIPDSNGESRAESLIRKTKRFSSRYEISADIYRQKASVACWLLFGADILSGERKSDFVELLHLADEITGIRDPKNIHECRFAVVLTCITHRRYIDGREIKPL